MLEGGWIWRELRGSGLCGGDETPVQAGRGAGYVRGPCAGAVGLAGHVPSVPMGSARVVGEALAGREPGTPPEGPRLLEILTPGTR